MKTCKQCKHWQGNKYSGCADCYRVLASIDPAIMRCEHKNAETGDDIKFSLPFDPTQHMHWYQRSALYRDIMDSLELKEGVTVERVNGVDYLKTNADFNCDLWEEK